MVAKILGPQGSDRWTGIRERSREGLAGGVVRYSIRRLEQTGRNKLARLQWMGGLLLCKSGKGEQVSKVHFRTNLPTQGGDPKG